MKKYIIGVAVIVILVLAAFMLPRTAPTSTEDTAIPFSGSVEPSDPVPAWVGTYEYSEFAPRENGELPMPVWAYALQIGIPAGDARAVLNIDGFQTERRLLADVKENNGKLDIIFDTYQVGNVGGSYKKGDLLLSLVPQQDGSLEIVWGKLKSNLISPGRAVFKKIDAK